MPGWRWDVSWAPGLLSVRDQPDNGVHPTAS
jgi:hypothetical protein